MQILDNINTLWGDDLKKMKMHSPDLIEGNIEKLTELFPNCVTESTDENGKLKKSIDFEMMAG